MPTSTVFIVALTWTAMAFAGYYFLSNDLRFAQRIGLLCGKFDEQGNRILLQRMLGLLFLGFFSILVIILLPGISPEDYGLRLKFSSPPPWWSALVIPVVLLSVSFAARQKGNLARYPQVRARVWTPSILIISAISWILFLFAYEFLLRGFLFFASLDVMETVPAIALNCALYALAHVYKGPGETFGAIPVGILLCYLTLSTGNIWSALLIHSLMALSNEWYSLHFHPDMELLKNPSK